MQFTHKFMCKIGVCIIKIDKSLVERQAIFSRYSDFSHLYHTFFITLFMIHFMTVVLRLNLN